MRLKFKTLDEIKSIPGIVFERGIFMYERQSISIKTVLEHEKKIFNVMNDGNYYLEIIRGIRYGTWSKWLFKKIGMELE